MPSISFALSIRFWDINLVEMADLPERERPNSDCRETAEINSLRPESSELTASENIDGEKVILPQSVKDLYSGDTDDQLDGRDSDDAVNHDDAVNDDDDRKMMASSEVPSTEHSGKPSSLAQLVRSWENYMSNDGQVDEFPPMQMFQGDQFQAMHMFQADQFQKPIQMFHQLNLCGAGEGLARLAGPAAAYVQSDGDLDQVSFKHTRSSPLRHTPSLLDNDESLPPPIGLQKNNRSRSTPLSTSANSAFGTILKTMPYLSGPDNRVSAFTLPPSRSSSYGSTVDAIGARYSVFNPIKYGNELDEVDPTSIEVEDLPPQKEAKKEETTKHRGTSFRAARFLADVRMLRRRRARGGRENPARPPSSSDESGRKADAADEETVSSKSSCGTKSSSNSSDSKDSGANNAMNAREKSLSTTGDKPSKVAEDPPPSGGPSYHQLDSDVDEECEHIQTASTKVEDDSPASIPSSGYTQTVDERPASRPGQSGVRIQMSQMSSAANGPVSLGELPDSANSPSPPQMAPDNSNLTGQLHDSPGTTRSADTNNTSGHTTHATSTTGSSGQTSQLSSISETDREVMEANKAGKLLQKQQSLPVVAKSDEDLASGDDSLPTGTNADGYVALADSPVPLREGANVPAERFFTFADPQTSTNPRGMGRSRAFPFAKKGSSVSPTTVSSSSQTTNSSVSSSGDEPPTFVSYLDRKTASDLTSLREAAETSSPREGGKDTEERESPSDLLGYSDVIFEEAVAPGETESKQPQPLRPNKGKFLGGRRIRSLPPRSPALGCRTPTTPPPRGGGSPAYCGLSPPRNIVDHRIDPNVSRPYVLRSTPTSSRLVPGNKLAVVSPEVLSSTGSVNYTHIAGIGDDFDAHEVVRQVPGQELPGNHYMALQRGSPSPTGGGLKSHTYDEHSIEIMKSDSKEEATHTLVSPEKSLDDK